ncbi:AMP-dependent synthetase and ligase family protein isoform X2 [Wolffia australiana]
MAPETMQSTGSSMEVLKAVLKRCAVQPDSIVIRDQQKSYSYAQLISSSRSIADLLCNRDLTQPSHGSTIAMSSQQEQQKSRDLQGARIGIIAKPSAEFVAGIFATWLSGGVAVPLAISYPESELLHVMNDSDVSVVLSTEDHQQMLKDVAVKCGARFSIIPDVMSSMAHDSISLGGEIDDSRTTETGVENALIVYTSGTTGKPKGVVHTHAGITAQVEILSEAWGYSSADQFLHCLPLHHVHGLFNALLAPLYAGSVVEFMNKFSVRGIWNRWRESYPKDGVKADNAITVFTGVPTMYTRLVQGYEAMEPELQLASAYAAKQLRLMMSGSSALPLPLMKEWERITGHRLLERYGMTEFVMALSNPLDGPRKGGTVGKALPRVQVKVISEDGSEVNSSEVGELCIKSPSLFKEYWKQPEITKESFIGEGFFKTGDTVRIDEDGYYVILGRSSADIMKVGGYKLSALEIESILLEHPAVSECSVLGLPDEDYGEAVSAVIVPVASARDVTGSKPVLTLEELRSWSKDKLAPYKIPTRLFLWDSLPRNAMGKVNKKELRKLLQ